ncbi:hypothetical protein [Pseudochrobactrum asaccharolyticum]|uniref:Uncharacterized protein n=1 Tax=Pseudochrobactrum asaccharolyticum TaxID=354351 RepID=A0A366DKD5_9HYPH|nr:hypothetical protein [Pseudochrobactrum asaccharolyticum]RBO90496.1 hypothetical protein DFR47_11357 [Pseudochrobactrum asaccharolyticum]
MTASPRNQHAHHFEKRKTVMITTPIERKILNELKLHLHNAQTEMLRLRKIGTTPVQDWTLDNNRMLLTVIESVNQVLAE